MLSKIGRPKTPSTSPSVLSVEASPTSSAAFPRSAQGPHPLKSLSISEGMQGVPRDIRYDNDSTYSSYNDTSYRVRSPSRLSSATTSSGIGDPRNHHFEWNLATAATEPEIPHPRHYSVGDVPLSHRMRRTGSRSMLTNFGEAAQKNSLGGRQPGRVKREPQDQSCRSETNLAVDLSIDESNTTALRRLNLDDRNFHPNPDAPLIPALFPFHSSRMQGTKRRAGSPPTEAHHGEKFPYVVGSTNEQYQRSASGHLQPNHFGSPANRYAQASQGSVSSTSSTGYKTGSFASSTGASLGASSMTSYSSPGGLSPGGVSPTSELQQPLPTSQYPAQISMNPPDQCNPYAHSHQRTPSEILPQPIYGSRKMSAPSATTRKRNNPNIPASPLMCNCCSKKPKKFDTLEELQYGHSSTFQYQANNSCRHHEAEKAYECQYCPNKFKNKNEMERHQNSLHLRRHSWSCASIAHKYEDVFHPSTTIPPNPNNSSVQPATPSAASATDICGYCGEEFSNEPPDWDLRIAHLTNQHKFGECNQSKKFYRADHFRQHLKHSHAGTAGKWTNMLEQACMRDEPPDPVISMTPTQQQPAAIPPGMQPTVGSIATQVPPPQMGLPLHMKQGQQQGIPMANMSMAMNIDPNFSNNMHRGLATMGMQAMSCGGLQQDRIDEVPEDQHYHNQAEVKGEEA